MFVPPIILFLVALAVVIYLCSKINIGITKSEPEKPELPLRFYDGPLDGIESKVPIYKERYFAPYIPEDEDEREVIGHVEMMGQHMEYYKPQWAMYEPVGDEGEYILTKTLTEAEAMEFHERGELE